jgi:multidrug efflux pump subunit AcrA (membrane-fusion protein)
MFSFSIVSCNFKQKKTFSQNDFVVPEKPEYIFEEVAKSSISKVLEVGGTIVSSREQHAYFDGNNGVIKRLYVQTGRSVKAGDVLAEMYTDDIDQKIIEKQRDIKIAEINLEKLKRDGADNVEIQKSNLQLELEKMKLERLKYELGKRKLVCQIDGIVTYSGNMLPGQRIKEKTLVYTISDPKEIQIEYNGNSVDQLSVGLKVNIYYKFKNYTGKVVSEPAKKKKTFSWENTVVYSNIQFDKQPEEFELGDTNVKLQIVLMEKSNVIVIPKMAIHTSNGQKYVLVDKNGTPSERYIQTGLENKDFSEVTEGLSVGEKIIVG